MTFSLFMLRHIISLRYAAIIDIFAIITLLMLSYADFRHDFIVIAFHFADYLRRYYAITLIEIAIIFFDTIATLISPPPCCHFDGFRHYIYYYFAAFHYAPYSDYLRLFAFADAIICCHLFSPYIISTPLLMPTLLSCQYFLPLTGPILPLAIIVFTLISFNTLE